MAKPAWRFLIVYKCLNLSKISYKQIMMSHLDEINFVKKYYATDFDVCIYNFDTWLLTKLSRLCLIIFRHLKRKEKHHSITNYIVSQQKICYESNSKQNQKVGFCDVRFDVSSVRVPDKIWRKFAVQLADKLLLCNVESGEFFLPALLYQLVSEVFHTVLIAKYQQTT